MRVLDPKIIKLIRATRIKSTWGWHLNLFQLPQKRNILVRKNLIENRVLPRLKKEGLLKLNTKIDFCLNNKKNVEGVNTLFPVKDLYGKSFLIYSLRKTMLLTAFGFKKQYFYRLIDIILALSKIERELFSNEIFSFFGNYNIKVQQNVICLKNIAFNSIFGTQIKFKEKLVYSNLAWVKLFENFNILSFKQSFLYLALFFNKNLNIKFNVPFYPETLTLEKCLNFRQVTKSNSVNITLRNLIRRKHLLNFLKGRVTNGILQNSTLNFLAFQRFLTKKSNLNFISKQGSFGVQTLLRFGIKTNKLRSLKKYKQELPLSLLYFITRLEEKKDLLSLNKDKQEYLLGLRNFFLKKGYEKFKNQIGLSLSTLSFFESIKEDDKKPIYAKILQNQLSNEEIPQLQFANFLSLKVSKRKEEDVLSNKRLLWKQKKLVDLHSNSSLKNIHKYFSVILGQNVSIIFINALALTKFAYVYPTKNPRVKKPKAQRFLNHIEREMIQRYKYVAIYIQDFIRICFLSFFLKKPTFIANFMGYQLAQLPRNRKETQFIRFLIKVLKIFGAQRPEIIAVKVEFKGRVNRWRRTKVIRGSRGTISFFKLNTRIEYGSGKAITRKGALGIRLWLCYKWTFTPILRDTLLGYIDYSQRFKAQAIDRFLYKFQSKDQYKSLN